MKRWGLSDLGGAGSGKGGRAGLAARQGSLGCCAARCWLGGAGQAV